MKFYIMCLGHEKVIKNDCIAIPQPEMLAIKSENTNDVDTYNIYGYLEDGFEESELKELITGLPLKKHSEAYEHDLGYYSKTEVSMKEVADFLRALEKNGVKEKYRCKINNLYQKRKDLFKGLEEVTFSDAEVISRHLGR